MADVELNLLMKARNLASGALDEINGKLKDVGTTTETTGGHFGKLGKLIDKIPFGDLFRNLLDLVLDWQPVRDIMNHVGAVIGEKLLPVFTKFANWIEVHLTPAIRVLAAILSGALSKALEAVAWVFEHVIGPAIEAVIGIIATLLGKIGDAIGALQRLGAALGNAREQNRGHDPIGDLLFPPHAAGGWVGLHGPEIGVLGEKGPEYVVPNNKLGGMMPGYEAVAVSEKDIARMVDERLYFTLRRAAPTSGRV